MTWYYKEKIISIDDIPENVIGIVYLITNTQNNKKYVGKKTVFSKRKLKPLKGKTRKRTKVVETDWVDYYGSSDLVNSIIEQFGKDIFKREILHFCYNKSEMSYLEALEQFNRKVLLNDEYYNEFIGLKIHSKGLSRLKGEI